MTLTIYTLWKLEGEIVLIKQSDKNAKPPVGFGHFLLFIKREEGLADMLPLQRACPELAERGLGGFFLKVQGEILRPLVPQNDMLKKNVERFLKLFQLGEAARFLGPLAAGAQCPRCE